MKWTRCPVAQLVQGQTAGHHPTPPTDLKDYTDKNKQIANWTFIRAASKSWLYITPVSHELQVSNQHDRLPK